MPVLAQFDFVKAKYPFDDERMKPFFDATAYVNGIAEAHEGFIWRQREDDWPVIRDYWGPDALVTLSVWRDVESLRAFLYRSAHREFLCRGSEWFTKAGCAQVVLWWIADDHRPDLTEAKARLDLLHRLGPTPAAFDLRRSFGADSECCAHAGGEAAQAEHAVGR